MVRIPLRNVGLALHSHSGWHPDCVPAVSSPRDHTGYPSRSALSSRHMGRTRSCDSRPTCFSAACVRFDLSALDWLFSMALWAGLFPGHAQFNKWCCQACWRYPCQPLGHGVSNSHPGCRHPATVTRCERRHALPTGTHGTPLAQKHHTRLFMVAGAYAGRLGPRYRRWLDVPTLERRTTGRASLAAIVPGTIRFLNPQRVVSDPRHSSDCRSRFRRAILSRRGPTVGDTALLGRRPDYCRGIHLRPVWPRG